MEIIQAERLDGHARLDFNIEIKDGKGWYYIASPWESRALISRSMVSGVIKKRQLLYLKAVATPHQIMATLNPMRIEPSAHVTRIRTTRAAKHWKECLDRADGGKVGGSHRSLFVGQPIFWGAGGKQRKFKTAA